MPGVLRHLAQHRIWRTRRCGPPLKMDIAVANWGGARIFTADPCPTGRLGEDSCS